MKTFYLVRHGQKDHAVHDGHGANMPLTAHGHEQAQKTGKYLKKFPITKILASPIKRVQQTAQHIAAHLSLPIQTEDKLQERMEFVENHYGTFEEFIRVWDEHSRQRDKVPLHGDSSRYAGERFGQVISSLLTVPDEQIVLATHGGIIVDFILNTFAHEEIEPLAPQYQQRIFEGVLVHECSITTITVTNGKYSFKKFSDTRHLK